MNDLDDALSFDSSETEEAPKPKPKVKRKPAAKKNPDVNEDGFKPGQKMTFNEILRHQKQQATKK